jgi:predicted DNA-binding protein with PD1-like motif
MRTKLIDVRSRTWAVVFDTGEEAAAGLVALAESEGIRAARLHGLGAFSRSTLAFFDLDTRRYEPIPIPEQVEVLSLLGNLARFDGAPRLHAHAVVSRRDGSTLGGHLLEGWVRPTLEVMVVESPEELVRETDPATGLPLLRP